MTVGPSSLAIVSADANGVPQSLNDGIVGHGGASATGTSSPLTVTGLANGVSYVCTVMAVNALGLFSTASNMMSKKAGTDLTSILMLLLD